MQIKYPYECKINTKEEAYDFILNKCNNCHRVLDCTGLNSKKCNELVEELVNQFGKNQITLQFPLEFTALAGNSYGRHIFDTQIQPNLKNSEDIVELEFPSHINCVAIGFVQGLIYKYGSDTFSKKFIIKGNSAFISKFLEDLRY